MLNDGLFELITSLQKKEKPQNRRLRIYLTEVCFFSNHDYDVMMKYCKTKIGIHSMKSHEKHFQVSIIQRLSISFLLDFSNLTTKASSIPARMSVCLWCENYSWKWNHPYFEAKHGLQSFTCFDCVRVLIIRIAWLFETSHSSEL